MPQGSYRRGCGAPSGRQQPMGVTAICRPPGAAKQRAGLEQEEDGIERLEQAGYEIALDDMSPMASVLLSGAVPVPVMSSPSLSAGFRPASRSHCRWRGA